nr:hypothetical protein [Pedobacter panaciterrae]
MKAALLISISFFLVVSLKAQTEFPGIFQKKLNDAKVVFVQPGNADPVPVLKNELAHYDYAIKLRGKNVEVRYSIWPLTEEAYTMYDKREKKEGDSVLHPNKLHKIVTYNLFNRISGNKNNMKSIHIQKLNNEGVKKDFGADVGSMYMGPVVQSFDKDHKYGFFLIFHKDNAGDIYILYLFENQEEMSKLQQEVTSDSSLFKAIKFK